MLKIRKFRIDPFDWLKIVSLSSKPGLIITCIRVEFHLRWFEKSIVVIGKAAMFPLIFNHLNRNSSKTWFRYLCICRVCDLYRGERFNFTHISGKDEYSSSKNKAPASVGFSGIRVGVKKHICNQYSYNKQLFLGGNTLKGYNSTTRCFDIWQ